jgi:hypothetical protein
MTIRKKESAERGLRRWVEIGVERAVVWDRSFTDGRQDVERSSREVFLFLRRVNVVSLFFSKLTAFA